ncbi:hypothetical protein ONZ45_g8429 [Pleurotus djamor]|nr:hypothetical protein ONZ45_g8429 [Pleurotus djamor]
MPGPGRRVKARKQSTAANSAASSSSSSTQVAVLGDVDLEVSWESVVLQICEALHLPNLATRHGLKKVHQDFDSIHRRLDQLYQRNPNNVKVMGGVVGVFAKMCIDAILRDKLMEKGFLQKLLPLLDDDRSRHMALIALSTVTHHGGTACRAEIARHSPKLVQLMQELPDDTKVIELCIVILSHSIVAVVAETEPPSNKALREIALPAVLNTTIDNLRKPTTTHNAINHAIPLLSTPTMNCPKICKDIPSLIKFLVAGLRSADWITRSSCLGGLLRLHAAESQLDRADIDPQRMIAAAKAFPPHIQDIFMAYGVTNTDYYQLVLTSRDNQQAFMQCAQDHNLYSLAIKLGECIGRTEYSITQGAFQVQNPRTGALETADLGLPFRMWADSLPHCAKAIREQGTPEQQHIADILDIKYWIMKQQVPRAVTIAKAALEKWPQVAYFYYAITLSADLPAGLRAAKKGLKCKQTTPFLRFQMLQRAVMHAGDLGIVTLQDGHDERKWEEGITFLQSAYDDAKTYLEQAPPDSRHIKNMAYWYILLTFVLKGPDMSTDMTELRSTLKKLQIADEITVILGTSPPKTQLRLTQQLVVKMYPDAVKEWGDVMQRFDTISQQEPQERPAAENAEDDLAAWLDGHEDSGHSHGGTSCHHPKVDTKRGDLYRCSWCSAPSAALRKCAGCSKTRYCDAACQKSHWKDHKKLCTGPK